MKSIVAVMAGLLLCNACVIDARDRKVALFDEPKTLRVDVGPAAPLWLRVPAGDIQVNQGQAGELRAELTVMCPSRDSRCAKGMEQLELITETNADGVHLALNKNRAFSYRNAQIIVTMFVPADHPLHLDVTAGDVDLDVANCAEVNMEAGDLTLKVPEKMVRSVDVDTGVGDATLTRKGRYMSGRRSLLIGAEIQWHQGTGDCDIVVDLQAGDAKVNLT